MDNELYRISWINGKFRIQEIIKCEEQTHAARGIYRFHSAARDTLRITDADIMKPRAGAVICPKEQLSSGMNLLLTYHDNKLVNDLKLIEVRRTKIAELKSIIENSSYDNYINKCGGAK